MRSNIYGNGQPRRTQVKELGTTDLVIGAHEAAKQDCTELNL